MNKLKEEMRSLIGLQECDNGLRKIQVQKEQGPARIQKLEQGLNAVERQLMDDSNRLDSLKRERRNTEKEIEDLEARIAKSNLKLSNIKSNKEYQAALREIADLNEEKSRLEDKAIEFMEKIEEMREQHDTSKQKMEEHKKQFEKDRDEILKELSDLGRDLDDLEVKRTQFCEAIDENILKKYDNIRAKKGGIAVSAVIKGVCQTCHLAIPPQKFNELVRGNELMACPHCKRIIYWGEDAGFEKAVEKN